jgi:heme/copper-type cytochrome/quinol oxidase subunit 3
MADMATEQKYAQIEQQTFSDHAANAPHATHNKGEMLKFAMWLFLASEVIIFTVMIVTYVIFRINNPEVVHEIHEATGIWLVTLNTFLLLTSSWLMVMGLRDIQLGNQAGLVKYMLLTALFGAIFVLLQGVEYGILAAEGITIYNSEFGMRFYAPTALHGAHVIVGVIWALFVARNAARGRYSAQNFTGVEVFGLYWHFVDVVWIVLFTAIYLI